VCVCSHHFGTYSTRLPCTYNTILHHPFTWYAMLPIATTLELVSTSRSIFCRAQARAGTSTSGRTAKVQVRLRTANQASRVSTAPFAYLSKRRNRPIITIAVNMSILSRRNLSTPSSSSSSSSSKPPKVESHSHSHADTHTHGHDHDHGRGHDHDHSHGGIFHSHAHDHSEGAEQIMTALTKGQLDRGTKITLLG